MPLAVVTGASSGIGLAVAEKLLRDGWTVVGLDIDPPENAALAHISLDVSSAEAVNAAFESLDANPDLVVNAAGIVGFARVGSAHDLQLFSRVLEVNLMGTYYVARAALALDIKTLVNVASAAWNQGQAYMSAYTASKAGVVAVTKSLALEFVDSPVTIAAVAPGAVATSIMDGVDVPSDLDGKAHGPVYAASAVPPVRGRRRCDLFHPRKPRISWLRCSVRRWNVRRLTRSLGCDALTPRAPSGTVLETSGN